MASNSASHSGIAPTARCPHGIGLALFDVDGTILIHGEGIRPRVVNAIRTAHELGVITVVSSGRPIDMIPEAVRDCGIMDYFVCTNGATVYDAHMKRIMDRSMPAKTASAIVWALKPLSPTWNAFVDGRGIAEFRNATYMVSRAAQGKHTRKLWQRVQRFLTELLRDDVGFRYVGSIRPTLRRALTVEKLGCAFGSEQITYEATKLLIQSGFEVAVMGSRELEITASGVTKGSGATWLLHHLNIDPCRAIAFGDGGNDAPLVGAVGTFIAMGNGDEALKAIATDVCDSIDKDGVALWLEEQMNSSCVMVSRQQQDLTSNVSHR